MYRSVSRRIRGTSGFNQSRNSFAPGRGFKSLTTSIMSLQVDTKLHRVATTWQSIPSNQPELVLEPAWGHNSISFCALFRISNHGSLQREPPFSPSCFELDVVFPQQIYSVSHQLVVIWLMSSCTLQTFDTSLPLKLKPSLSRMENQLANFNGFEHHRITKHKSSTKTMLPKRITQQIMIISHSAPLASTFLRHQGLPSPSLLWENMFEETAR